MLCNHLHFSVEYVEHVLLCMPHSTGGFGMLQEAIKIVEGCRNPLEVVELCRVT